MNSLKNYTSFFCIHRCNEKNHIHFTIKSSLNIESIKNELKSFFNQNSISIDKIFLVDFNPFLMGNTLNYLLRRGNHNKKNDLIDWGLITPKIQNI